MKNDETRIKLLELLHEIEIETIRSESRIKFIKSFNSFFQKNGYLTAAQQKVLNQIHEEVFQ